jgi:hypothetical protein
MFKHYTRNTQHATRNMQHATRTYVCFETTIEKRLLII